MPSLTAKSSALMKGVSRFNQLLNRKAEPILYAFDLLWLDGKDLRQLPLIERKSQLAHLVESSNCERLLFAQHVEGEGKKLFKEICSRDLEGIVAKRKWGFTKTMEMLGSRSRTGPILRPKEGTNC